jgi:hypothetical protein
VCSSDLLKKTMRLIATRFSSTIERISDDLVASPGFIAVGFDKGDIIAEAGAAGLKVKTYSNRFGEYPFALLVPEE